MAASSPIPTLLAFLVCDTVIQDAATRKKTLVGVFDRIMSPTAPIVVRGFGLYAKMVEGSGDYDFKVRLVNLKDESPIIDINVAAKWTEPEEALELGINLGGVPLKEFGSYEFQLYANEAFIGRAVVRATKLEIPPPKQAGRI